MIKNFSVYAFSETGKREKNEDNYIVFSPKDNVLFLGVSDGMGGHECGDIASRLVVESCKKTLNSYIGNQVEPINIKSILIRIFYNAQKEIRDYLDLNGDIKSMGATLACMLMIDNCYGWGNIGDSRIYRILGKKVQLLTRDHSLFNDIGPDLENYKIDKNLSRILTRAIDGSFDEPDIFPDVELYSELKEDESFLLCSDGLIVKEGEVNDDFIFNLMMEKDSPKEIVDKLIRNAIQNGSNDNITVIYAMNRFKKKNNNNILKYFWNKFKNKLSLINVK